MPRHRLVVIGDSLSQGFMSGAIHRADISYPVMLAHALGVRDEFVAPDFAGEGGLPLNLELVLSDLSRWFGRKVNWWEVVPVLARLQRLLDRVEDHWEKGRGSKPFDQPETCHNLAVWGFEVRDAYTVTEEVCREAIPKARDNFLSQIPEMPMYRTARRVLNPTFGDEKTAWSQVQSAHELAQDGGIENLIVALGANNALGTVISLNIKWSEDQDLERLPHQRTANLYRTEHFDRLYRELADAIGEIGAQRVFVATVPHVTIPPITRGVSPGGSQTGGYYEYYTRPWIWDDVFDPEVHQKLEREQAREIDATIDDYNTIIRRSASDHGFFVFDMCKILDDLAFRRSEGRPRYTFPEGLVTALRDRPNLSYLVDDEGKVRLDTRFVMGDKDDPRRIARGGIFSIDGIHPTTIGYSVIADALVKEMVGEGVDFPEGGRLPWDDIVAMDTLINEPPAMLAGLKDCLAFLDRHGLLSSIIKHFE